MSTKKDVLTYRKTAQDGKGNKSIMNVYDQVANIKSSGARGLGGWKKWAKKHPKLAKAVDESIAFQKANVKAASPKGEDWLETLTKQVDRKTRLGIKDNASDRSSTASKANGNG